MLELLLENNTLQVLGAVGFVLASAFAFSKGLFGSRGDSKEESEKDQIVELINLLHQKLQLIHEDVNRISDDTPHTQIIQHDIAELKHDVDDITKTITLLMQTVTGTHDGMGEIHSNIIKIKERIRSRG